MPSFGEELKRERELRQISRREVCEATKISIRYLEALEHNEFRHLPGGVFNRGFVKAVAEYIGVDPEAMVNAYLLEEKVQGQEAEAAEDGTSPYRGKPASHPASVRKPVVDRSRQVAWVVLVLSVLVVVAGAVALTVWLLARGRGAEAPAPAIRESENRAVLNPAPPSTPAPEPRVSGDERLPAAGAAAENAGKKVGVIEAEVLLQRAMSGRLNCDNRRVEVLEGLPRGASFHLRCRQFLLVDAADGGGLLIGLNGSPPAPVGRDGAPVRDYRITLESGPRSAQRSRR